MCILVVTVTDFAKLTGDLPVLSAVDLRVLALTWMLQKECGGIEKLRTTPLARDRANAASAAAATAVSTSGSAQPQDEAERRSVANEQQQSHDAVQAPPQDDCCKADCCEASEAPATLEHEPAPAKPESAAPATAPVPRSWAALAATPPKPQVSASPPPKPAPKAASEPTASAEPEVAAGDDGLGDLGLLAQLALEEAAEGKDDEDGQEAEDAEEEEFEDLLDDQPLRVLPGLYIGSIDAARNGVALAACGVTHLLTVSKELSEGAEESAAESALQLEGRKQMLVPVADTPNPEDSLLEHFESCCKFIHAARGAGGAVLVHCIAGRSRSAAVVCAYLVWTSYLGDGGRPRSVQESIWMLRQSRPWAKPNKGFVSQLHDHAAAVQRESKKQAEAEAAAAAAAAGCSTASTDASSSREPLDGDIPWITASNLKQQRHNDMRHSAVPDEMTAVACVTTDYAMQSVLLQMGLKLLSTDGLLMRSIKQWVLKCSGCFTVTRELDRSFCAKCGNSSLVRLAAIIDQRGNERMLPERGAPARVRSTNIRGTKYPMPMPKTGRHAQNLVLAEDQLAEAKEKAYRQGEPPPALKVEARSPHGAHLGSMSPSLQLLAVLRATYARLHGHSFPR